MQLPELIVVDNRFSPLNEEYAGNDLITAVPSISEAALENLISNRPLWFEVERSHAADARSTYVLRLADFVFAMPTQLAAASALLNKKDRACHSFWMRRRRGKAAFNALVSALATNSLSPSVGDCLLNAPNVCIFYGTPGCSKSTTLERTLGRLQQGVLFHRSSATYQVLLVVVQVQKGGSFEALAEALFRELVRHARATGLPFPWSTGKLPRNHSAVLEAISDLLHMLNVAVVAIEELQHLFLGTAAMDRRVVAFLTTLVNLAPTLFLFLGTWELMPLLGLEGRLARRSTGTGYFEFGRMSNLLEFTAFMTALWPFQWTGDSQPLTAEVMSEFSQQTMGVHDLVVKLYMLCQLEVIARECPETSGQVLLDETLVREVAQRHFKIIAPAIRQMRAGRKEQDQTLWDVEPVDTTEYVRQYQRHVLQNVSRNSVVTIVAATPAASAARAAVPVTGSRALPPTAHPPVLAAPSVPAPPPLATETTPSTEGNSTEQLAPPRLRPTRSKNARVIAERDQRFTELEDGDLRRHAYFAMKTRQPVVVAFEKAGVLCNFGAR